MQQFKFRYVNQLVGTFVILVVLALLVGIFLAGQAQQWFVTTHRYNLEFPPEGSLGLQENSQVVILGAVVGSVEKISVDPEGSIAGRIAIKGDFYRFIRENSKAIVKKKFVVAGDSFIEITRGTGRLLEAEETLACEKDTEITEYLEIALENFQEALLPVADEAQELLGNLNRITEGLAEGEGAAGAVLRDPEMAARVREIVARLEEMSRDVARVVATFPPMAETMAGEVEDIPGLVVQSREMLRESQRLIEALQDHWLIRGYVDQAEQSSRIPSAAVTVQ
jgi:phospholipid/cholesterol/gamma-HCH transport system substrate-binding protein